MRQSAKVYGAEGELLREEGASSTGLRSADIAFAGF